jgi:Xaa-Pro dipeptidase
LFGVVEESCYAAIDLDSGKATLFVPKMDDLYKIWMTVLSKEDFHKKYEIEAYYIDEISEWLASQKPDVLYVNQGTNSDSGLTSYIPEDKHITGYNVDRETIYEILAESRVIKTEEEIDVMRWATKITVEGHVEVLRAIKSGMKEL